MLRLKAHPVSVSLPWGLTVGFAGFAPYLPLPVRLRTGVLAPIGSRPGETREALAARVEEALQRRLTLLAGT